MALDPHVNPQTGVWDDSYYANVGRYKQGGEAYNGGGSSANSGVSDPIQMAKQVQQFNISANQPAIQNLQGQIDPLKQRYSDLLTSIKGQQQVAENATTLSTNNELAARGILSSSGLYQKEQAQAQQPIAANFQNLSAQTGVQENADINSINNAIAQLQTGDPGQSAQLGFGYAQQQAALQNAIQQAQIANQYHIVGPGGQLYSGTSLVGGGGGGGISFNSGNGGTKKPLQNIFGGQ